MEIIFWIIGFLFSVWLLISPFVCLYWVFEPMAAEWFWWKHKYIYYAIGLGGFFGCAFIIGGGITHFLWFIPVRWFIPNDWPNIAGEFKGNMVKWAITTLIGLYTTSALWHWGDKTLHRASEDRIAWDIKRKKRELRSMDKSKRSQAIDGFRQRKEELEKLLQEEKISPFKKEELIALDQLLEELDKQEEQLAVED
jgi:hypothetical protein